MLTEEVVEVEDVVIVKEAAVEDVVIKERKTLTTTETNT